MELNKKFTLTSNFEVHTKATGNIDDPLYTVETEVEEPDLIITGYANAVSKDRTGDVIPEQTWRQPGALDNYRKNPIILAYHDHTKPIGTCESLQPDSMGLKITAKISEAAGDVYDLIKAGILKSFSIGFMVKDATYDSASDIFVIKELELLEVSVVSVPMNQDSIFSISKGFDSENDYLEFKKSFKPTEDSTKEIANEQVTIEDTQKDNKETIDMDKEQLDQLVADAAEKAAAAAVVKGIELGKTGAERLLADAEKRIADSETANLKAVEDLRAELAEKAAEIKALNDSKMKFEEKATGDKISYKEKEAVILLAKATGKAITETSLFQNLVQKYGAHIPSATWELEVSTNMQEEIRRALLVDPLFKKNLNMNNPVMRIPVNPEAGLAAWVLESGGALNYKTTGSSGNNLGHTLKEVNLTAYKLATKDFLGAEEEADSIIPLLPMIRDAIVRRTAKAWDQALLRGTSTLNDPIKGVITHAAGAEITTITGTFANAKATVDYLLTMRRSLGTRGLDPANLAFIVSNDMYYDLLDDVKFQTMDKVGNNATLLTGQVGMVANVPIILSGEFEAKAVSKIGAVLVDQSNFLVGRYKGLRVESDYIVENQQRIIVASQRVGFQQISTVDGNGAATLKYPAA